MSAMENLGCQFDPVSYTGWKKSAAGFGKKGEGGNPVQNSHQQANEAGAFMAVDESSGISHSDYKAAKPMSRTTEFYGSASAISPN